MKQTSFSTILTRYIFGFGGALFLSAFAYLLVTEKWLTGGAAMAVLLLLAAIQLSVQLICFLHLGRSRRSRNRGLSFLFVFIMSVIIVVGSIWIMNNLDYRMSTSSEAMNEYMQLQNKKRLLSATNSSRSVSFNKAWNRPGKCYPYPRRCVAG